MFVAVTRWALVGSAVAFAAALALFRAGRVALSPSALAALGGAVAAAAIAAFVATLATLASSKGRWRSRVAEAALYAGLALASGTGLANWALGYQGFVLLTEGEDVALASGQGLRGLSAGPLARLAELRGTLRLANVSLRPAGDGFVPESSVALWTAGGRVEARVTPDHGAAVGPLVLFQGAFGFAPRLVVKHDGATVLDTTVHFESRRVGPTGVAFETELPLEDHGVAVEAAIDVSGLDEAMRGHPKLTVRVRRGEEVLGEGALLPGHGATMREGWQVGFAGLKMWSEIDVSRRSHRRTTLAGAVLALAAAVAWAIAAWRGR